MKYFEILLAKNYRCMCTIAKAMSCFLWIEVEKMFEDIDGFIEKWDV